MMPVPSDYFTATKEFKEAVKSIQLGDFMGASRKLADILAGSQQNIQPISQQSTNLQINTLLNLATCYLRLGLFQDSKNIVDKLATPDHLLSVSIGHKNFGQLAELFSKLEDGFCENPKKKINFQINDVDVEILYLRRGIKQMEKHNYILAVKMLEIGLTKDNVSIKKEIKHIIQLVQVNLAKCYISLKIPQKAKDIISPLLIPDEYFSVSIKDNLFLEVSRLKSHLFNVKNPTAADFLQPVGMDYIFDGVKSNCLYGILCLSKNSSTSEIKHSYHELTKMLHPDKGGNDKLMQENLRGDTPYSAKIWQKYAAVGSYS
ncbi:hypothetical protein PPACK8108_LOCUS23417 [Phakopsora pachyrhizi]|uniref:J domain-containing protein n=1 Tax=Phakopsora pachyrhizi TaxID=170000 RepID=A0AAV0BMH1_PHAPC|nr:hypothetical protein PPACK8108_LOCUS23417 [Phakopsora pachyrhizi]